MKKLYITFLVSVFILTGFACDYATFNQGGMICDPSDYAPESNDISIDNAESNVFSDSSQLLDDRFFVVPPTVVSDAFDYKYSFYAGDTLLWNPTLIERYIERHISESESCAALCLVRLEQVMEDPEDELWEPFLVITILEIFEESDSCYLQNELSLTGKGNYSIIRSEESECVELRCSEAGVVMNDIESYYIAHVSYHGDKAIDIRDRIYDIRAWSLPINSKTMYNEEYYNQLCDTMNIRYDVRFRSEFLIEKYCYFPQ